MPTISATNQYVYRCDTCNRDIRVPANPQGLEVLSRCIVTASCLGKMLRVTDQDVINSTPSIPLEVAGLKDWSIRNVLFTYTQSIAMSTWKIAHNLENNPTVYVYVQTNSTTGSTLTQVEPESIKVVDLNNITITFKQPYAGLVQCVALSSQNAATPSTVAVSKANTSDMSLTNQGEITFATLDPSSVMSIKAVYNSTASPQPVVVEYLNFGPAGILSPWDGANYVTINSKRYYVRSVNLLTQGAAPVVFQSGLIGTGSTLSFPDSTAAGKTLILLANAPQTSIADRIYDRYVDTASANVSTPLLYYSAGNVYVAPSLIKNTYPPIAVGQ